MSLGASVMDVEFKAELASSSPRLCTLQRRISWVAASCALAIGCASLGGWAFDIEILRRLSPARAAINPMTAAGLILLAAGLLLKHSASAGRARTIGANALALAAGLIGMLRIADLDIAGGAAIDGILYRNQTDGQPLDRMATNTAISFMLDAIVLLLLNRTSRGGASPAQIITIISGLIAVLAVLGHGFGADAFYTFAKHSAMAPQSAVALLLFAVGALFARPHCGFMRLFGSRSAGGVVVRRVLPMVLLIPPALVYLRLMGERAGLYESGFGAALVVVSIMGSLGTLVGFIAASLHRLDVRRETAESALRHSEQRLGLAVRGSSDGLWDWDIGSGAVWYAASYMRLLGHPERDVCGTNSLWEGIIHPQDRQPALEAVDRHLHLNQPLDFEQRLRTLTGEYRCFRTRGAAIRAEDGKPTRLAGSIQDVTELKRAEDILRQTAAELVRSNRDLEEFAYVASHDLRAPLRAITNLAGWIKDDLASKLDDENRERLDLLLSRANRLDHLISDLLQYSRAGRVLGKIGRTDIGELVDEVRELLCPPAGFEIAKVTALPTLQTASAPLQQVLCNLVQNAIKHHDQPGGRIEVGVKDIGDFYQFSISDDGPGIPLEYQERVFGLFETLQPRDSIEGSGMGLAVVKRTVEKLGGTIVLESDGVTGTTFRFTWPKVMTGELHTSDGKPIAPDGTPAVRVAARPGRAKETKLCKAS